MAGDQLSFQGVGYAESQDRIDEHRTGVPPKGGMAVLLDAPARRTSKVMVFNTGAAPAEVRLKNQGATKTQTNELISALGAALTVYNGQLGNKSLVPKSVSITNAGAPVTVVDDGLGNLYDTGFVGVAANKRGTINYLLGIIALTFGAAATEPVNITYQHTDYTNFASPSQTTVKATGAVTPTTVAPFVINLGFGRANPFSIAMTDGAPKTWVDDGKGNIIETTGGIGLVRGTVDYALGIITLTAGGALVGNMTTTYTFNPFGAFVVAAGGQKGLELFPGQIPELSSAAWATGLKNNPTVGLVGESRNGSDTPPATTTNLVTQWSHYSEEPYRVRELFSGFPPGGATNDPRLAGQTPFSQG